jgi:SAM-dependent methyltransferase
MSFDVTAPAYDRFMGPYSTQLAVQMADLAGVEVGQRALDVGCGTGALTGELVRRLGPGNVVAADPSPSFAAVVRERYPGVEVIEAPAEALPFADGRFDAVLAQLVVHFMRDPVGGVGQMRRVGRPGAVVAACVWDYGGGTAPLGRFWEAARELVPDAADESGLPGVHEGQLEALFSAAGLRDVVGSVLEVGVRYAEFEDWWKPLEGGVGPAGAFVAALRPSVRDRLRARCMELYGPAPMVVSGRAWAARGVVP